MIAAIGIAAGAACGYVLGAVAASYSTAWSFPRRHGGVGAAVLLLGAAVLASLIPAARASRVDVVQALRSE